ncbi:MAG: pilus assembly protein, partial [Alphaproteobacteria bacterium]|nr:pilus assembly protein [Alphaproteobacteria bacterium]
MSKRKKTGLLKSKHAGVAVEFALIAPILFLFVLGIVDFGRAVILSAKLSSAARAGAQYAIIVSIEEDAVENA